MHEARQHGDQGGLHIGTQLRKLQATRLAGIGNQNARAARDRHHGQLGAERRGLVQEQARRVHHLRETLHAHRTVLREAGVVQRVVPRQCAGVGGGSGGSGARAARLDGDDRFTGTRGAVECRAEGLRAANVLDVDADHLGLGIGHQKVDGFGRVHVAFVAGGDPVAEADSAAQHDVHPIRAERAALADKGEAPRAQFVAFQCRGERGHQARAAVHDTQAIGAQNHHAVLLCQIRQARLQNATGFIQFGKARRENHEGLHPRGNAFTNHRLHMGRSRADDGQVDRFADGGNAGIAAQPLYFRAPRVDGIQLALVATREHVGEGTARDFPGIGAGTDDGHAACLEDALQARWFSDVGVGGGECCGCGVHDYLGGYSVLIPAF